MMAKPYDIIVFDLDGTLVDTAALHVAATQAAARAVFGQEAPPALVARSLGQPLQTSMRIVADGRGSVTELMTAFMLYYSQHESEDAQCFPAALPTLAALQKATIPLALLSNKLRAWGQTEITRLGLTPYFTQIVFMEDMPSPKPSPLALQPILHTQHTAPGRLLLIGDGVGDLQCAHSAGAQSGAALWGPHDPAPLLAAHPTHALYHMADILQVMGIAEG
jgi:phosphoglycolate phosphatase